MSDEGAMSERIAVEVVYGNAERQKLIALDVAAGTTVYDAAEQSNMVRYFPELDLPNATMGIFSRVVAKPREQLIKAGDRVEIYRPLSIDPMEARRARAAKRSAKGMKDKSSSAAQDELGK
jgi:putative ubiquitin-RnfH superfamily antitoxin RatB of RatAB toxin-antitoxin module